MNARIWGLAQGTVAALMVSTIFYTVTGFILWLGINVAAGIAGFAAVVLWRRPRRAMHASTAAAGLFAPVNMLFGTAALISSGPDAVPVAILVIAVAQCVVAWAAVRRAAAAS